MIKVVINNVNVTDYVVSPPSLNFKAENYFLWNFWMNSISVEIMSIALPKIGTLIYQYISLKDMPIYIEYSGVLVFSGVIKTPAINIKEETITIQADSNGKVLCESYLRPARVSLINQYGTGGWEKHPEWNFIPSDQNTGDDAEATLNNMLSVLTQKTTDVISSEQAYWDAKSEWFTRFSVEDNSNADFIQYYTWYMNMIDADAIGIDKGVYKGKFNHFFLVPKQYTYLLGVFQLDSSNQKYGMGVEDTETGVIYFKEIIRVGNTYQFADDYFLIVQKEYTDSLGTVTTYFVNDQGSFIKQVKNDKGEVVSYKGLYKLSNSLVEEKVSDYTNSRIDNLFTEIGDKYHNIILTKVKGFPPIAGYQKTKLELVLEDGTNSYEITQISGTLNFYFVRIKIKAVSYLYMQRTGESTWELKGKEPYENSFWLFFNKTYNDSLFYTYLGNVKAKTIIKDVALVTNTIIYVKPDNTILIQDRQAVGATELKIDPEDIIELDFKVIESNQTFTLPNAMLGMSTITSLQQGINKFFYDYLQGDFESITIKLMNKPKYINPELKSIKYGALRTSKVTQYNNDKCIVTGVEYTEDFITLECFHRLGSKI